jgi:guanylate kinase
MPRLIHLNGPSRVGKTTLARRYVDEHRERSYSIWTYSRD